MRKANHAFCLYVAGNGPNSARARENLAAIVAERLGDDFVVEEVDVLRDPLRALADKILVTPTLVMHAPGPPRRIVGNLNERDKVLLVLGL